MVQNPEELESALEQAKPVLQEKFGISKIGYFGSFAKGDVRPNSDIDLLVYFNRQIGWDFFDLPEYLGEILGRKVDVVTEGSIKKRWKASILQKTKFL